MSSPAFRAQLKAKLAVSWSATPVLDLSDYVSLSDLPVAGSDPQLLLHFIGGPERIATIAEQGNHGWREEGVMYLHLLMPTGEPSDRALQLGEDLRTLLRGQRLGAYVIEDIEPFSDFAGAAIRLNGRWHGWSAGVSYYGVICA